MIIGLTGGIASGKSTVSRILEDAGVFIIDADIIAHNIIKKGKPAYKELIDEFGEKIIGENKEIDRKVLGKIVFAEEEKLKILENITHPHIFKEISLKLKKNKDRYKLVILVAPLLYETSLDRLVEQVWLVYVDQKTQIERLRNRDDFSLKEARKRIAAQMSLEEKKERADLIIDNNGRRADLKEKIRDILDKFYFENV